MNYQDQEPDHAVKIETLTDWVLDGKEGKNRKEVNKGRKREN